VSKVRDVPATSSLMCLPPEAAPACHPECFVLGHELLGALRRLPSPPPTPGPRRADADFPAGAGVPVRCLARSLDSESATALRALAKVEVTQVIALHQATRNLLSIRIHMPREKYGASVCRPTAFGEIHTLS